MSTLMEHIARVDARNELDVDLDREPQCESPYHTNPVDTNHGGEVHHWMTIPCGCNGLRCAEFVADMRLHVSVYPVVTCSFCGETFLVHELRFIEL